MTNFTHPLSILVSSLVFGLALGAAGCADDPSPLEQATTNLCLCNGLANGSQTAEELAMCEAEAKTFLAGQPASCLSCLNTAITDTPTEASCAASDSCGTCVGGD